MRRVVVTGLGIVSPLGRGVDYNWKSILDGKSGIRQIQGIDLKDIPVHIAGQVPEPHCQCRMKSVEPH